jgi:hypothetical protein
MNTNDTDKETSNEELIKDYCKKLLWSKDATEREKLLVVGNIRAFFAWINKIKAAELERVSEQETGINIIARERERQISEEGFTLAHDDQWTHGELIDAAVAYATNNVSVFPWKIWHPSLYTIQNLARAGALIAAEIDRLQRRSLLCAAEENNL